MSGGGSGGPTTSTTTQQNYSPEEAAQRAQVQQEAARIYGNTASTISSSPYPGARPVGLSPESTQAQSMLGNYALGQGQQTADQAGGFSSFLMGPAADANSNPYLQSAIGAAVRPISAAYTDPNGVFSSIRTSAMQDGGQGTNTRQGIAEGIAGKGYINAVGDVSSKMAYQNYGDSMKLGAQALALAPQTYNLGTQPAMNMSTIGSQNEMAAQQQEDYAAQTRAWDLNSQWAPLQNYANIVYGGSSPGTTSVSNGALPQQNKSLGALGGAASGAMIGTQVGGAGWGTVIGAGIGLLAGLM